MKNIKLAFFGTPTYSLLVLRELYKSDYPISIVVTKPPRPLGRKQVVTSTPVAKWAQEHDLPLLTPDSNPEKPWLFSDQQNATDQILRFKPDLLVTADYTQKIPLPLVKKVKYGGLNVHPSSLPAYRGPAPIPWAILRGETKTGVSIVTLVEEFDQGRIVAQEKEPILATDTTDSLLTKLLTKGGELLVSVLPKYLKQPNSFNQQWNNETMEQSSYFPRLTRADGFIPWELIKAAMEGRLIPFSTMKQWNNITICKAALDRKKMENYSTAHIIERAHRALHPWPGIWTKVKFTVGSSQSAVEKRLKFLKLHLLPTANYQLPTRLILDQIQLEGKPALNEEATRNFIQMLGQQAE